MPPYLPPSGPVHLCNLTGNRARYLRTRPDPDARGRHANDVSASRTVDFSPAATGGDPEPAMRTARRPCGPPHRSGGCGPILDAEQSPEALVAAERGAVAEQVVAGGVERSAGLGDVDVEMARGGHAFLGADPGRDEVLAGCDAVVV